MAEPSLVKLWSQAVVRKAASLFFPREQFAFQGLFFGPARTTYNYAADVGDGLASSVVMPVVQFLMRAFPEAPLVVRERKDDDLEIVPDHPLVHLVDRPNDAYPGTILWMATITDWAWFGESYWRILRSRGGYPAELWWIPPWSIKPKWPDNGFRFISHYDYQPSIGPAIPLDVEEVIHFRHGLDPRNMRHGLPPLRAILQDIWTDGESANFVGAMLRNMGIPGLILSPKGDERLSQADVEQVKAYIASRFTGDHRGQPLALGGPTDVHKLSLSPTELDMSALRNTAEERVCCIIGTMIHTKRGVLPIEQVRVGDEVITHQGQWRQVLRCFERDVDESLIQLTAPGLDPLIVTDNHHLHVATYRKPHQIERLTYTGMSWMPAGAVTPRTKKNQRRASQALTIPVLPPVDTMPYLRLAQWLKPRRFVLDEFLGYVTHPSPRVQPLPSEIPMNAALGRLLGFYMAEGSKGDSRIYWAFNALEVAYHQLIRDDLLSLFGLESKTRITTGGTGTSVVAQSAMLQDLFPDGTASTKMLPAWAWQGGDEFRQALLWAWAVGDGSMTDTRVRVTTVSPHLARQMQVIAISCGFAASVQRQPLCEYHGCIQGRAIVHRHPAYIVRWHRYLNPLQAEYRIEPDGHWTSMIRQVERIPYRGKVYNLEVDEDHSYLTTGGMVHNCAALGIPSAVVGFKSGLENSKVGATMAEFVKLAWSNGMVPMQRLMAAELQMRLLPLFEASPDTFLVGWNYDEVSSLQEDQNALAKRYEGLWEKGLLKKSECRQALGYESDPEDEIYFHPNSGTVVDPKDQMPEPVPLPVPAALPAAPGANGNGNGAGAPNGNGAVQQRALTKQGMLEEWLTTQIGRRAQRLDHPPVTMTRLATRLMRAEKRLQPEFQRLIGTVLERYGTAAATAAREIFPQKASVEDMIRTAIITERVPLASIAVDLTEVYATIGNQMVDLITQIYKETLQLEPTNETRLRTMVTQAATERVKLLDLDAEAKAAVLKTLDEATQQGLSEDTVVQMIRDRVPAGRWSSSEVRAQIIARSESRFLGNMAASSFAEQSGIGKVLILDALLGPTDNTCEVVNGWVVTPGEARALAASEHPQGTRMVIALPAAQLGAVAT